MNVLSVVVQIVDPENGQRTDPRQGTREALTASFVPVSDKDEFFLNCFVLVLMEEIEREGEVGFQYSIAPLMTVRQWISFFPVVQDEVIENE